MRREDIFTKAKRRAGQIAVMRGADYALTAAQDDLLDDLLVQGLMRIAETGRLEGTVTIDLVAGTYVYDLPDEVRHVSRVFLAGNLLESMDAMDAKANAEDVDGEPKKWGIEGRRLYVNKTPEDAATITLHVNFNAGYRVAERTDIIERIPPEFEPVIVDYILGEWFAIQGDGDLAAKYLTDFEAGLLRRSQRTETPRISARTYRYL